MAEMLRENSIASVPLDWVDLNRLAARLALQMRAGVAIGASPRFALGGVVSCRTPPGGRL